MKKNSFLPFDHVEKLSWGKRRGGIAIENKLYVEEKFLVKMTLDCDPMPEFWVCTEWQIHACISRPSTEQSVRCAGTRGYTLEKSHFIPNAAEILPARDLHDKLTYFVRPSEISEKVKDCMKNAGI